MQIFFPIIRTSNKKNQVNIKPKVHQNYIVPPRFVSHDFEICAFIVEHSDAVNKQASILTFLVNFLSSEAYFWKQLDSCINERWKWSPCQNDYSNSNCVCVRVREKYSESRNTTLISTFPTICSSIVTSYQCHDKQLICLMLIAHCFFMCSIYVITCTCHYLMITFRIISFLISRRQLDHNKLWYF